MKNRKLIALVLLLPFMIKCKNDLVPNKQADVPVQEENIVAKATSFAIPAAFTAPKKQYYIDPSKDTVLSIGEQGTQLHIPQNAFVNKLGEVLTEKVNLSFQEYTNSAEMAFSKIPMTYNNGSENLCFNSSGMFSIQGDCLGQEAFIAEDKALKIDYFLPLHNENIDFYRLKEDSSNWELIAEIEEIKEEKPLVEERKEEDILRKDSAAVLFGENDLGENHLLVDHALLEEDVLQKPYIYDNNGLFLNQRPDADVKHLCDSLERIIRKDLRGGKGILYGLLDGRLMNFLIKEKKINLMPYVAMLPVSESQIEDLVQINDSLGRIRARFAKGGGRPIMIPDNGNRSNSTLLAEGMDKGHTYPPIIKGLNIKSFGVYNCDQIYRLPNPVNLLATYVDEKGNTIEDGNVLSMIDLNYNGAFSFAPGSFLCSVEGNNVLALFTHSGKLYVLEKGAFEGMNIKSSGAYTFAMTDMTETIGNTADLAAYLDIEM